MSENLLLIPDLSKELDKTDQPITQGIISKIQTRPGCADCHQDKHDCDFFFRDMISDGKEENVPPSTTASGAKHGQNFSRYVIVS